MTEDETDICSYRIKCFSENSHGGVSVGWDLLRQQDLDSISSSGMNKVLQYSTGAVLTDEALERRDAPVNCHRNGVNCERQLVRSPSV